jgi:hypothetical protein
MQWDSLTFALSVVTLPAAASYPPIARRIVYFPAAPWIAFATALLAVVAAVLGLARIVEPPLAIGLLAPLFQVRLVQLAFRTFVRIQHREPIDTAFNWSSGLAADRVYAFLVVLGGTLPFAAVLALFARAA